MGRLSLSGIPRLWHSGLCFWVWVLCSRPKVSVTMLSPTLDLVTLSCSAPTTAFPLRALHQSGSGSMKSVVPPPCSIAPSPNAIGVLCSALTTMCSTMFYGPAPPHLRITCPRLLSHLGKLGGGDAKRGHPLLGQRLGRWGQVSECAQAPAMERYVRAGTQGPELDRPEHPEQGASLRQEACLLAAGSPVNNTPPTPKLQDVFVGTMSSGTLYASTRFESL